MRRWIAAFGGGLVAGLIGAVLIVLDIDAGFPFAGETALAILAYWVPLTVLGAFAAWTVIALVGDRRERTTALVAGLLLVAAIVFLAGVRPGRVTIGELVDPASCSPQVAMRPYLLVAPERFWRRVRITVDQTFFFGRPTSAVCQEVGDPIAKEECMRAESARGDALNACDARAAEELARVRAP